MTRTSSQRAAQTPRQESIFVEDVVSALLGSVAESDGDLRAQMEHAAVEFDRKTAAAFGKALLDSLCEDPSNVELLEALVVLGLAHGEVLEDNRISLAVEARRLAVLLERSGEVSRAQGILEVLASHMPDERIIDHELAGILRRSGQTEELIERYLARAARAVEDGNVREAIPWLQEILLIDRTRRDIARIIRDLRYGEAERLKGKRRRLHISLGVVMLSTLATLAGARELRIYQEYSALPQLLGGQPESMYERAEALSAIAEEHRVWLGAIAARSELDDLHARIARHSRQVARAQERERAETLRRTELADAARMRGFIHAEREQFEEGLVEFEAALREAPEGWAHEQQIRQEVAAIRDWLGGQGQ